MYVDLHLDAKPKRVEVCANTENNGKISKEELNRLVQMNDFLDALKDAGFFVKDTEIKVRVTKGKGVIQLSIPEIKGSWRRIINLL